jgi:hypothetical protein
MKKNYLLIGAGLLLVYWFLKNKKAQQPELKTASDDMKNVLNNGSNTSVQAAAVDVETPLLISPSQQQTINEFKPGKNDNGKNNITVRYIAGTHYI